MAQFGVLEGNSLARLPGCLAAPLAADEGSSGV
jgi:hypothetical protein